MSQVPIAPVARNLGLPLHQIDTFTKWTPPTPSQGPFNLIVAVSFGLLVPPRILSVARYGGLNVHPSLLPEYIPYSIISEDPTATDRARFRGPAPLHHTLLRSRTRTGVTLQTLHPTKFDGGIIIEQTPFPGIEHGTETVEELRDLLAPMGAQTLVQALRNGTFMRPIQGFDRINGQSSSTEPSYAHKIGPEDRHIDWNTWTASDILKRQKVIGPLWNITEAHVKDKSGQQKAAKRIIWDQGFSLLKADCHLQLAVGHPTIVGLDALTQKVCIRTCDGNILVADKVKVEGQNTAEASMAARRTGFAPRTHPHELVAFYSRLE
ncbi:MAG: hypothetical protein Q9207_000038 [Kuettlingeria erythrocarpa]